MTATPRAGGLTSLVFPAYNPGPRVAETWQQVRRFLDREAHGWEVLFVCDGCTDGTPDLLARLTAGDRRVRVLGHAPNRGKGFAVRRGLAEARGDWRVFADVDLAYGLAEVDRVARELRAGAAVVIASRRHPDSRVESPPGLRGYLIRRRLQSLVFNALTHLLLPVRQRDTQAGLKGMSAAAAHALLPRLACDGFGFDCELLTACSRLGIAVTEVPVRVRYDDAASTTDVRAVTRILRELWHIRRAWRGVTPDGGAPREPGGRVSRPTRDNDVRRLVVTADDFGIGPATSRGILDLAERGLVTGTVLLVNSPHAEEGVRLWRAAGASLELGWHACLTLDRPVLPPGRVRTLVRPDGRFHGLGGLLRRLLLGRVSAAEVEAELAAQLRRFLDLVGRPPGLVNGHHHVHLFAPVTAALTKLLARVRPVPYFRRVREPWAGLARFPGALPKRAFLGWCGRRAARALAAAGFPGNDWLALVSDPPFRADAATLGRWLGRLPPGVVELSCHPGYHDRELLGRDAAGHADLMRRAYDQQWLSDPAFAAACRAAGYALAAPRDLFRGRPHPYPHAV